MIQRNAEEIFAEILENRNVKVNAKAEYLSEAPKLTYNPLMLPNMEAGVDFVLSLIKSGSRICIYGDYDVDGVMGSVVLKTFLDSLGAVTGIYIPDRIEEGYGLNMVAIDSISSDGYDAIITVDCGTVSMAEVAHAKSIGVEIMITDHHEPADSGLPDCIVINPKIEGDAAYPFKEICGAMTAFKLCQALTFKMESSGENRRKLLNSLVDLVTVATIADVMPLVDENRTMVKWGLRVINGSGRRSLAKLCQAAGLAAGEITARSVAFAVAPRINSVGRLAAASAAAELFLTTDEALMDAVIADMNRLNDERRALQSACESECLALSEAYLPQTAAGDITEVASFLLLSPTTYHEGVSGIVAGRVKDRTGQPTAVLTPSEPVLSPQQVVTADRKIGPEDSATGNSPTENRQIIEESQPKLLPTLKGSARSIGNLNIIELLRRHNELFLRLGGHKMAAGFTILAKDEDELRLRLTEDVRSMVHTSPDILKTQIKADVSLAVSEVSIELTKLIDRMEPFGHGNHRPLVEISCTPNGGALIEEPKLIGKGKNHLSFSLSDGKSKIHCVWWNNIKIPHDAASIIGTVEINVWRGIQSVQLIVESVK